MLGLRDYVAKNGFKHVVLGLSGGIDSAVVAAMAADALGAENVHCLMLPYRYTSEESIRDAKDCAERLGVRYDVVSIGTPVDAVNARACGRSSPTARTTSPRRTSSRACAALTLMAVSNKLGSLLLTTGNKSEMAVGYATIYGDMNGGFNPIKDMLKMQVYELAAWRNANVPDGSLGPGGEVIPPDIIDKAPSAELRPNQTDQDSLPPYPVLDAILAALFEDELPVAEVVKLGFDRALVKRHREDGLHRRVQAPAVGAGREAHQARLRARPEVSDHQRLPRRKRRMTDRPLRPVADRAPAYRQCPAGGAQLAVRAGAVGDLHPPARRHRPRALDRGVRARASSRT